VSSLDAHLLSLLLDLTAELPEVTGRRMFGSDALFANGTIFAIVWDGRVTLRFPDEARFAAANALEGAGPFDPMGAGKTMGRWVCMPEAFHDDVEALSPWVELAHRLAMSEPPKTAKRAPKRAPKVRTARARARRRA
jgi:TfoX/Sxy family transcriptional regulator of competence genes